MVGTPEITPPDEIDRPGGAPESDHDVITAVDEESVTLTVTVGEMAVPALDVCDAGAVTVITLLIVQLRTVVPWKPAESVAWTVAE